MTFEEIREDLKVSLKFLKKLDKSLQKTSHQIRKVEEFNEITKEICKVEHCINLLETIVWILKP